jgi:hypothetical protein
MGRGRSEGRWRAFGRDVKRSAWLPGLGLMGALLMTEPRAAEPPAPDDGLLEFLGSVDSEDKDWHDYLARTDIDQVAAAAAPSRPKPAASSPDPPPDPAPKPLAPKPVTVTPP